MANYELWLTDQFGGRLALLDNAISFTYASTIHGLGFFSVMLPASFERGLLQADRRVAFYRKPTRGMLGLDYVGFIRANRTKTDVSGQTVRVIEGRNPNHLLDGRIIRADAGSSQAEKTGPVDDVMKEIVFEQAGAGAGTRAYPAAYFDIQLDAGAGPSKTMAFSNRAVLDVLKDLNEASRQTGPEVFFNVLPVTDTAFQFMTATGQLGRDLTDGGMVFGIEYGNLRNGELTEDWRDERNLAYALGAGTGAARYIATAEDTDRSGRAWYSRGDVARNCANETNPGADAIALSTVTARRPVMVFSGDLLSIPGCEYGLDWRWGDRILVTFDGLTFDALIRTVTVSVDENGKETISSRLEAFIQ